ncbi:FxDxF family PEP-CTERM protein [Roseateles agri]|nr:FxDxF family PEP-CTERM protein [Paucibacter sp. R3-3]
MNLKKFVLFAPLALIAAASFGQGSAPIPLTLTATGPNLLGTTFQRSVSDLFVDVFSFTPESVKGTVSVNLASPDGSVTFFSALLNNEGFSAPPGSAGASWSFQAVVDASQPLSLTVFGYGGDPSTLTGAAGTYTGTFEVQVAVPEPETFVLMLLGLGMIGGLRASHSRISRRVA